MDDVVSVRNENANLRKIQSKLLQWEVQDNPLAPLSQSQIDVLYILSQLETGAPVQTTEDETVEKLITYNTNNEDKKISNKNISNTLNILQKENKKIDSVQDFLSLYDKVDLEILERSDEIYKDYYDQLTTRSEECETLLLQINATTNSLNNLTHEYEFVSQKTSSLHVASEKLLQEQSKLNDIGEEIKRRLYYFNQVDHLTQKLHSPTISPSSEMFFEALNKIDECLEYLRTNVKFKESNTYIIKYKQCLGKAVQLMKSYVTQILINATDQVLAPKLVSGNDMPKIIDKSSDTAFALFYGKFQASSGKVKRISNIIEGKVDKSSEYSHLLSELHQCYLLQRAMVMSSSVESAIKDLTSTIKGDHCALVRKACAFLVHVCQDEYRLFYQFFTSPTSQLTGYMDGLCTILYDSLRPYIIHIVHLETLAEICSILRVEMLEEHVTHNPESLEAFGKIAYQLLQDVQERLVFRAHIYLQSDILNYKPSSGDLAYPEKLEMMESIALSLQEPILKRSDSRSSMISMGSITSQEVENINAASGYHLNSRTGNSPADLHGMWYPTVRRTLVCLSRLYRCVERPIFQGLSQEALTHCIHSVSYAAQSITEKKTSIDGELFEIKHLLILREQIAPFRVDFTVKETSLDFSKVKTAAYGLIQKRRQLFSLGTNNALLEFLLEGTPQVKEHLLDSRKEVDRQLKTVCELFIKNATRLLIGPLINFNEKSQNLLKTTTTITANEAISVQQQQPQQQLQITNKINYILRQSIWASPQQISGVIQESQRLIKNKLGGLQRSMQLYLANKDTEFILFRPIRNNIISAFVKLEQILTTNGYTKDDLVIASCPSAEQISVLLSSASIINETMQQTNINRKLSTSSSLNERERIRKISTNSSIEKKVSFDKEIVEVKENVDNTEEKKINELKE